MRPVEMISQLWFSCRGLILLLGTLLLANLLLYVVLDQLVVPRVISQERNYLQRQAEVRQLLHAQGSGVQTPEQEFVLARQDLAKFHNEIPEYHEFTGLVEELMVLAGRARLNITQISYQPEELPKNRLLRYDLGFNVSGDYEQVKKFIHSLEQSARLMSIRQIGLQGTAGDGVNLRLLLETYFRPAGETS